MAADYSGQAECEENPDYNKKTQIALRKSGVNNLMKPTDPDQPNKKNGSDPSGSSEQPGSSRNSAVPGVSAGSGAPAAAPGSAPGSERGLSTSADRPGSGQGNSTEQGRPSITRVAAVLVLIPAVPGLLGSIAAMLLFYFSPGRFNRLLERLPGETVLRSLLFFAPSALFAVVLLAVLYAREGSASRPQAGGQAQAAGGNPVLVQFAARSGLFFGVPGMLAASAALLLSFASPSRFQALIEPLPGTRYIEALLPFVPLGLLFVVVPSLLVMTNLVSFGRVKKARPAGDAAAKFSRGLVLTILIPSVMLLAMAVAALALSYVSPPHFEKLVDRLTSEGVIRLGLLFGFSALLAVVLLSSLFLLMRPGSTATGESKADPDQSVGDHADRDPAVVSRQLQKQSRPVPSGLVWILSTGLFFTLTSSVALFGVALYLLVR
jgi:hypothetical protein